MNCAYTNLIKTIINIRNVYRNFNCTDLVLFDYKISKRHFLTSMGNQINNSFIFILVVLTILGTGICQYMRQHSPYNKIICYVTTSDTCH